METTTTTHDAHDADVLAAILDDTAPTCLWRGTVATRRADVVELDLTDGRRVLMPRSEWFAERNLPAPGDEVTGVIVADTGVPTFSATHPDVARLAMEDAVPETWTGEIRVMGVARRAGVRTKIAVAATVEGLDPIAVCVGRQANRVKHVSDALGGERVDIITWHDDPVTYLTAALSPASVLDVAVDNAKATVTVAAHQVAAAVGAGGQNSSLAAELVGMPISITAADS